MMKNADQSSSTTTALITGASSGIGSALARVFAHNGHNLVVVARDRQRLDQLAGELREQFGITVKVISKDLSVGSSVRELFDEVRQESIPIDILVNNAGLCRLTGKKVLTQVC